MTLHPFSCQIPIAMPVPVARHFDAGYTFGKRRDSLTAKFDLLFEDSLKEWMSFKPALGLTVYPCYACRHMFSTKSAFQDHVNRRVLILRYNCIDCTEMQPCVFYNRCALLLHLRTHFDLDRGEIDLEALTTDFLPIALAGFLPHPDIARLYDAIETFDKIHTYINSQFYAPELTERGKQVVVLKANSLTFQESSKRMLSLMQVSMEIPRCEFITSDHHLQLKDSYLAIRQLEEWQQQQRIQLQALVSRANVSVPLEIKEEPQDEENSEYHQNMTLPVIAKVESLQETTAIRPAKCLECNQYQEGTMAEHYLGDNRPADMNLSCPTCKFIASTECSLKAHIRIHSGTSPHVCPDCGRDFDNSETLREHMEDVCFHIAKLVRYRCPGKKCGKLFANNNTFGTHFKNHMSHTLTCSLCHAVLDCSSETENHRLRHPEEERQDCLFRRKHHCFLCPDENITDQNYMEHINMHTSEMDRCIYVYMCRGCRSNFRSTATYATHLLRCNGRSQSGNPAKKKSGAVITKDCEGCDTKIIYVNEKSLRFCNGCKMTKLLKAPTVKSEQEPEKPQASDKMQKPPHKRYYCILCEKKINVDEKVRHMRLCEFAHPLVVIKRLTYREIPKYTFPMSSRDEFDSPPSKRRSKSESPNKDEHRRSRKRPSRPRPRHDLEPDLTADDPMKFEGTYYCKLCDFKSEDRQEFHQHIKVHRDVSTAYQCMECGECFVVKPSLMKHLMHFHNVSDCEAYLERNDCYDVDAVKELQETVRLGPLASSKDTVEPLKENQCRVCREQYEDSASLNKHFRTHGMAFLLRNSK